MSKLSVHKIRSLDKPGMHHDGDTLYLNVSINKRSGAVRKSWIQRIVINGKRRDIGLGGYPLVSLREARETALDNRRKIFHGGDPLADRAKPKSPIFREAARRNWEANRPIWRNNKTTKNWLQTLERHAFPKIGDIPVDRLTKVHVLSVLAPIWTEIPEVARKVRQRIRHTLEWCMAHGFVEQNVAGEVINGALPKTKKVQNHMKSIPHQEVANALRIVDQTLANPSTKLAFRFAVLTAARSMEVREATWDEIKLDERLWKIPARRMKADREHRVPLSDATMEVLRNAAQLRDKTNLIFPSARGRPLSDATLSKLVRENGIQAVPHGFRHSFRNWCADTNKPRDMAELSLAHTIPGIEGEYFTSDILDRRRVLMQQWGEYVTGEEAKVVELRA